LSKTIILKTIRLAFFFDSVFSIKQVYKYLPASVSETEYNYSLMQLENENEILIEDDLVFENASQTNCHTKRNWSQSIFKKNKKYISLISYLPWIKFIGLTGANAFESCKKNDDVDMFIVTQKNRLWLTYLLIVILSKLFGKRNVLCVNYLVDTENLKIKHKSYYNAVQLLQMKSIFNPDFKDQLIYSNKWIFDFVPNANYEKSYERFYLVNKISRNGSKMNNSIFSKIDNKIYEKYSEHLKVKYNHLFGKSLIVDRGIAKLHRQDNHKLYSDIFESSIETNYSV
jgi:hypothetical protein